MKIEINICLSSTLYLKEMWKVGNAAFGPFIYQQLTSSYVEPEVWSVIQSFWKASGCYIPLSEQIKIIVVKGELFPNTFLQDWFSGQDLCGFGPFIGSSLHRSLEKYPDLSDTSVDIFHKFWSGIDEFHFIYPNGFGDAITFFIVEDKAITETRVYIRDCQTEKEQENCQIL